MLRPMTGVPDLRAWLQDHSSDSATLSLSRVEIKAIFDEMQRLKQANDMLRKQNRKVRGKVARLRGESDPALDDSGPEDP